MGFVVDHTQSFRDQVKELARVHPPEPKRDRGKRQGNEEASGIRDNKLYLQEAYLIVSIIVARCVVTIDHLRAD